MPNSLSPLLDEAGRIKRWPSKPAERDAVLKHLVGEFQNGRDYTEKEVNAIIQAAHSFNDFAMLRRELIGAKHLSRTPDCGRYWVE